MFVETAGTITSVGGSNKRRAATLFLAITAASQIRGKMVIGTWNGQSERGTICVIHPISMKLNA